LGVFQESFLAEATDDALSGADSVGVRIGARGRAGGAARVEDFVLTAFLDRWEHHEGRCLFKRVDLGALDSRDATAVFADVIFLAGAAGDAVERAGDKSVLARSIATFAFAEFLVGVALFLG